MASSHSKGCGSSCMLRKFSPKMFADRRVLSGDLSQRQLGPQIFSLFLKEKEFHNVS